MKITKSNLLDSKYLNGTIDEIIEKFIELRDEYAEQGFTNVNISKEYYFDDCEEKMVIYLNYDVDATDAEILQMNNLREMEELHTKRLQRMPWL